MSEHQEDLVAMAVIARLEAKLASAEQERRTVSCLFCDERRERGDGPDGLRELWDWVKSHAISCPQHPAVRALAAAERREAEKDRELDELRLMRDVDSTARFDAGTRLANVEAALRLALPYVKSQADAEHMLDGFGPRQTRDSDRLVARIEVALASPSTPSPAPSAERQLLVGGSADVPLNCPKCGTRVGFIPAPSRPAPYSLDMACSLATIDRLTGRGSPRPERSEAGAQPEAGEPKACARCRHARPTRHDVVTSLRLWCACPTPPVASDPGTLAPTFDRRVPDDYYCALYQPAPSPGPASEPKEPQ
jgi:hypothetical protein